LGRAGEGERGASEPGARSREQCRDQRVSVVNRAATHLLLLHDEAQVLLRLGGGGVAAQRLLTQVLRDVELPLLDVELHEHQVAALELVGEVEIVGHLVGCVGWGGEGVSNNRQARACWGGQVGRGG
jgi:hypothetical protein